MCYMSAIDFFQEVTCLSIADYVRMAEIISGNYCCFFSLRTIPTLPVKWRFGTNGGDNRKFGFKWDFFVDIIIAIFGALIIPKNQNSPLKWVSHFAEIIFIQDNIHIEK